MEHAKFAEIWRAVSTYGWGRSGTPEDEARQLIQTNNNQTLLICALASISESLVRLETNTAGLNLLVQHLLVPFAQREAKAWRQLREAVESRVRELEKKKGRLVPENVRSEWIDALVQRYGWLAEVPRAMPSHDRGPYWRKRMWMDGCATPDFSYIRLHRPYNWSKRTRRWKVLDAWMKRRRVPAQRQST